MPFAFEDVVKHLHCMLQESPRTSNKGPADTSILHKTVEELISLSMRKQRREVSSSSSISKNTGCFCISWACSNIALFLMYAGPPVHENEYIHGERRGCCSSPSWCSLGAHTLLCRDKGISGEQWIWPIQKKNQRLSSSWCSYYHHFKGQDCMEEEVLSNSVELPSIRSPITAQEM